MISEKSKKVLFYFINGLTVLRIILSVIILCLFFSNYRISTLILFLIAVLTDLLDGDLARRFNLTSPLGKDLDAIADLSLIYSVVIPLFISSEVTLFFKIAAGFGTFLVLIATIEHTIKNKKLTLPGRRPSTTINSYFIYTCLAFFIINSPYKYPIFYLTCFILSLSAFDYFINPKK